MLKVKDQSYILSAQYLVNCLEEDHVCHGITTQEPRPMKETLHSRHHSTTHPRLGSSRKESHQNLHTHAVDSSIQLQENNRVLKERPPPISDEEQRLNLRHQYTLSQLQSGHCHLLQDNRHMVLGEPSDICTDCAASPQDVRHLFTCTTHPTDLSPDDIWRNRLHEKINKSHRKEWIGSIHRDLSITKNILMGINHFHEDNIICSKYP